MSVGLNETDGGTRARSGPRERRNTERRAPLLPNSNQQNNRPRHRHAGRRASTQVGGIFPSRNGRHFRWMRIIERQQREHHRRRNDQRLGVRGERLEILRDLRMGLLVAIVRAAFPGVRGGCFRVAIFPVRPVAVIARQRDGSAGAEAEKAAANAEKLRAHDCQHAQGEQQFLEM